MDEKGRISIPASIRKSFGLREGNVLELVFDLGENLILLLVNGQGGVTSNIRDCGTAFRGSRLLPKAVERKPVQISLVPGENPGPDPGKERKVRKYG